MTPCHWTVGSKAQSLCQSRRHRLLRAGLRLHLGLPGALPTPVNQQIADLCRVQAKETVDKIKAVLWLLKPNRLMFWVLACLR